MNNVKKRALLSVFDKTKIVELAKGLSDLGFEIISTGGTLKLLIENKIDAKHISEITNFPEILNGRVKTLHPKIYGGLLAKRDNPDHVKELEAHKIGFIDVVAVNLYPFEEVTSNPNCKLDEALENIDIGGPTMIRASSKNFKDVIILTDPTDYKAVLSSLSKDGDVSIKERLKLALKAFKKTSGYDAAISKYLEEKKV